MSEILYQVHGYKNGHQLLNSNVELDSIDQDSVDRLSDISGALRPGEDFSPYLTCYPLPSEKYFIIARTWQDSQNKRAGCVITKSLLIPFQEWIDTPTISTYFQTILEADSSISTGLNSTKRELLSPYVVEHPEELVESIFLEHRQPILVFNSKDAENITIRLYSVFWPSLRGKFACCTYALSQRSINNRLFDLLFAPQTVKTKFSEWQGRRIDLSASKPARHRWTLQLTESIFYQEKPTLYSNDILQFTPYISDYDEGTVRLTLLWNELSLKAKTESSPMAVLGLLDIINSQDGLKTKLYNEIKPLIIDSVLNATKKLAAKEAWKFYGSLLIKHQERFMDRQMMTLVKEQCTNLAELNSNEAISFIYELSNNNKTTPSTLYASIGDGISKSIDFDEVFFSIPTSSHIPIMLAASSKALCSQLLESPSREHDVIAFFEHANAPTKYLTKAEVNLAHFISKPSHKNILSLLLDRANNDTFPKTINIIGKNTSFATKEFNPILIKNAKRLGQVNSLVNSIVEFKNNTTNLQLVIDIINSDFHYIEWFIAQNCFSNKEKNNVLTSILSNTSSQIVNTFNKNGQLSHDTYRVLMQNTNNKIILGNFVTYAKLPSQTAIDTLSMLKEQEIVSIDKDLLMAFLLDNIPIASTAATTDKLAQLTSIARQISAPQLINRLLSGKQSSKSVRSTLTVLIHCNKRIQHELERNIDHVSILLAKNLSNSFDKELVSNWLSLTKNSSQHPSKQTTAAGYLLNYAYSLNDVDPTDILEFSFPIVYKNCKRKKSPALVFPFFFFKDLDKCAQLQEELIDRYFKMQWPPLGLLKISYEVGILDQTIDSILSRNGGKKFLNEAKKALLTLDVSKNDLFLSEIKYKLKISKK